MLKVKRPRVCGKGLSPVISVLLMIAIVVVASLVAYSWVMGFIGSASQRASTAIQIQSVARDPLSGNLVVYVQNVGQGSVKFDPAYCVYVNSVLQFSSNSVTILEQGQTATLTTTYQITNELPLTIKVVTADGVYSQTITNTNLFALLDGGPAQTQLQIRFILGTGGSSINPTNTTNRYYSQGARTPIIATPKNGYTFNRWTSNTTQISFDDPSSSSTWATVNGNGMIIASFTQSRYQIAFTLGAGGATMSPSGTQTYIYGARVSISTSAQNGYTFVSWLAAGQVIVENANSASTNLTVNGPGLLTATFTQNPYSVTFATNGGGAQSSTTPTGTYSASPGAAITISANPGAGYTFTSWTTTGAITFDNSTSNPTKATINSPGQITANFAQAQKNTPQLTCTTNATTLSFGEAVSATGTLLASGGQSLQGKTVTIAYSLFGHNPASHIQTTDSAGVYADLFTPDSAGIWTIQSIFAGDSTYNPASSSTQTLTVSPPNNVTINFEGSGIGLDTGTDPLIAIDSTAYAYDDLATLSFNWTPGTTHVLTAANYVPTGDSSKEYAWLSWNATSFTSTASMYTYTVPNTSENVTVVFTPQTLVMFAYCDVYETYNGNDPTVTYFDSGVQNTVLAPWYGSSSAWVDVGSQYSYPAALPDFNQTMQWQTTQTEGTVEQFNDWIQPLYYGQNMATLSYAVMGDAGNSLPPTLHAYQLGSFTDLTLTSTPTEYWLDQFGWSIDQQLPGNVNSGEAWQTSQQTEGTADQLLPNTVFTYYHQFELTVTTNQPALSATFNITCTQFGTTYQNQQLTATTTVWLDAGTTANLSNAKNSIDSHIFQGYTPSATTTMDQPKTIFLEYS